MRDEDLREAFASWLRPARRTRAPDISVIRRRLRRRRIRGTAAGLAVLAVVAGTAFGAGLTAGRSPLATARPTTGGTRSPATCTTLHVTWSKQSAGTMPGSVYALVFGNNGTRSCVLEGWPKLTVRGPASLRELRILYSSSSAAWGTIAATRVMLRPGADAAADVLIGSAANPVGCGAPTWSVTAPGSRRGSVLHEVPAPLGHPQPAGPTSICANEGIEVSAVYPGDQPRTGSYPAQPTLATSSLYPAAAGPEPPACAATAIRAQVTGTKTDQDGSFVILRLSASGPGCAIRSAGIPTIRLHEANGTDLVGKEFSTPQAYKASRSVLRAYGRTAVALPLSGQTMAAAVLLLPRDGASSCGRLTSLTIYPTLMGSGPGRTIGVSGVLQVCGIPRVLAFLPVSPASETAGIAVQGLQAAARLESGLPALTKHPDQAPLLKLCYLFWSLTVIRRGIPRKCQIGQYNRTKSRTVSAPAAGREHAEGGDIPDE